MKSWFKEDVLAGKTALVIGGSSESGPAVCKVLAEHGANVAFTYLHRQQEAKDLAKQLTTKDNKIQYYQFDLFSMEAVHKLPTLVYKEFGKLDLLVNLGGPPPIYTNLHTITEEDFDTMLDSHFKGNFFLSLEAAKIMEKNAGGIVVNISATSSLKSDHSVYGLAKACQNEMTGFLANTFAPQVKFLTIIPGLLDNEDVDKELRNSRAKASPLKRNVSAEEIGNLIISACSTAFLSITGQTIVADGGFFMLHP